MHKTMPCAEEQLLSLSLRANSFQPPPPPPPKKKTIWGGGFEILSASVAQTCQVASAIGTEGIFMSSWVQFNMAMYRIVENL